MRITVCRVHIIFSPLNCRWAVTFEAPKVTKSASSSEGFFAAQALRCMLREPQHDTLAPHAHLGCPVRTGLCPAPRKATIVLPAFGRSCLLRRKKNKKLCHCERGTSEATANFAVHRALFERLGMVSDAHCLRMTVCRVHMMFLPLNGPA